MTERTKRILLYAALILGALVFIFPFYFMVIGAFQESPTNDPSSLVPTGGWTVQNFTDINSRIPLGRALLNSGIFTAGVLLGTLTFGLLAGYASARLRFRGRTLVFVLMLLVQMIPFQLLMVPLYVLLTRTYGLGDTHLGIILPFLINTTAVFIFRQFFRSLPESIFESARIDGASEIRMLWSIALPLVRPAVVTVIHPELRARGRGRHRPSASRDGPANPAAPQQPTTFVFPQPPPPVKGQAWASTANPTGSRLGMLLQLPQLRHVGRTAAANRRESLLKRFFLSFFLINSGNLLYASTTGARIG